MKAAVYLGAGEIEIQEIPEPDLGPNDVMVKPKYVGICGSDLSAYEYGMYERGLVMGHEFSGEVVDVGEAVTQWKKGDRVVPNSLTPCKICSFCTDRRYSLCEDMQMVGISMNGGLAELVALPETTLHALPDSVDFQIGALVEPLSIALRGFNMIRFNPGNSVLVLGTGPIGIMSIHLARLMEASVVYASEPLSARRSAAKHAGADAVFDPTDESVALRIENLTQGLGVDSVVECTGEPGPTSEAFQLVKRGGKILVLGISEEPVEVDFMTGVLNELTVQFSYLGYEEFPEAIRLLEEGAINPRQMITSIIPLRRIVEDGFEALAHPESAEVKVLVEI
ncbi:MAG: alcohol dehydrogenase catalytic domain-containing protein [Candidatus Thorarchaeota archaeon]|nr:MAG: alcohol dehydrogenase catalytic domain-containing protein [Candidatus Thorarchaeota archaeon]